jgi:hypothetical protein
MMNECEALLNLEPSNFTSLDRSHIDPETYSVVTNCNNKKGMKSICKQTRSSSYALSGGREMLPETRKLIIMHSWEEYKIWSQENLAFLPRLLDCESYSNLAVRLQKLDKERQFSGATFSDLENSTRLAQNAPMRTLKSTCSSHYGSD